MRGGVRGWGGGPWGPECLQGCGRWLTLSISDLPEAAHKHDGQFFVTRRACTCRWEVEDRLQKPPKNIKPYSVELSPWWRWGLPLSPACRSCVHGAGG